MPRSAPRIRRWWIALAVVCGCFAAPATGAPVRFLDAPERIRVLSLADAPATSPSTPDAQDETVLLPIPATAAWEPVPPSRAAALGAGEGRSLWHLSVSLPAAAADGVSLVLGGRPLHAWRRPDPPVVPGFLYQPGGFVPAGLYVALASGQSPRGTPGIVRFAPTPGERARRVAAAGGVPPPDALVTLVERANVARPALLVPAGTALEIPFVPPAGARLRTALARSPVPLTDGGGGATTLRVGVVADGDAPTWLLERRFASPPPQDEPWLPIEADLARWSGRPIALRLELAADAPDTAPLHVLADPEVRGSGSPDARPNLLLLLVDGLRADRLSAELTPNLVRLAARGTRFAQARASAPWTRASVASLFTGVLPTRHGAVSEAASARLAPELPTLAGVLRARGYATAAFSANLHLAPPFGLARGFSVARVVHEDGSRLRDALVAHLERDAIEPWFVFGFFMDTHHPFRHRPEFDRSSAIDAPLRDAAQLGAARDRAARGVREATPEEIRKLAALYDENVRHADARIGELLDALSARGVLDRTLVVVTADHGEAFGEHGSFFHGHDLHEELLRVPLLVAGPGVPAGAVRDDAVSLVDLPATLLAWLGASEGALPGRDLRTPCAGPDAACAQVFETRFRGADQAAVLAPPYKLVVDRKLDTRQLFDLGADPRERSDLATREAERARALAGRLEERLAEARRERAASRARASAAPAIDPATAEALRALGYVTE